MSGHAAIAAENAALRLQLAAFQRRRQRPVLITFDRLFWAELSLFWNGWRAALRYVQPDTVVRWQRERFRKFWARLSSLMPILNARPLKSQRTANQRRPEAAPIAVDDYECRPSIASYAAVLRCGTRR
jgi:hypothetical protein